MKTLAERKKFFKTGQVLVYQPFHLRTLDLIDDWIDLLRACILINDMAGKMLDFNTLRVNLSRIPDVLKNLIDVR